MKGTNRSSYFCFNTISSEVKKTFHRQMGSSDCGVACMQSLLHFHGRLVPYQQLLNHCNNTNGGINMLTMKAVLERNHMDSTGLQLEHSQELKQITLPCILLINAPSSGGHFVLLYGFKNNKALIGDPKQGLKWVREDTLWQEWSGHCLLSSIPKSNFQKIAVAKQTLLRPLLKNQKGIISGVLVLSLTTAILSFIQAFLIQRLVDDIIPQGQWNNILFGLGVFVTLLLAGSLIGYIKNRLLIKQIITLNGNIADRFFKNFIYQSYSFSKLIKPAEVLTRLNDSRKIQKIIQLLEGQLTVDVLFVLLALGALFVMVPKVAMATTLLLMLFILYLFKWSPNLTLCHQKSMSSHAKAENQFLEVLNTHDTIQAFNLSSHFQDKISKANWGFQRCLHALGIANLNCGLGSELLSLLITTVVLLMCASMFITKQLQLGSWLAVFYLIATITPIVPRLFIVLTNWKEAQVALQRIKDLMPSKQSPSTNVSLPQQVNYLSAREISIGYPGLSLFTNKSFNLSKGTFTVLTGLSGSGKSTLLEVLMGLSNQHQGAVFVNNLPLHKIHLNEWRSKAQLIPQNIKLFNCSIADNITLHFSEDLDQLKPFLIASGFAEHLGSLRLNQQVGPDGIQPSAGETQMIGWARALIRKPQVLLIDEATSNLDLHKKAFLLEKIQSLKTQCIILMVTHDQSIIDQADQVINL